MSVELVLWRFSFASVMVLVGLTAHQLICLSDLEYDYINPYDSSSRINAVVVVEYALQAALCASFFSDSTLFSISDHGTSNLLPCETARDDSCYVIH